MDRGSAFRRVRCGGAAVVGGIAVVGVAIRATQRLGSCSSAAVVQSFRCCCCTWGWAVHDADGAAVVEKVLIIGMLAGRYQHAVRRSRVYCGGCWQAPGPYYDHGLAADGIRR
jgi:hypothetical protein